MRPFKYIKIAAIITAAAVFASAFSGCSLMKFFNRYNPSNAPTVAPKSSSGSAVALGDRKQTNNGYGYSSLGNDELRSLYDTIGEYMNKSYEEEFTTNASLSDFDFALGAYEADHPEEFWLDLNSRYSYIDYGFSFSFKLNFEFEGDKLSAAKETFEQKLSEITGSAPQEASDYQIEIFANNYLIDNCSYDNDNSMRHNAYGALIDGKAVCDGYSKAFQVICNSLGVECVGINGYCPEFNRENGESSDTGHMWNCVKIDGDWYHIDVTWNDGDAHIQRYLYFNMTTEKIKENHVISPLFADKKESDELFNVFVPECTSDKYNYMKREFVTLYNLDEDSELLAEFLAAVQRGDRYFDFLVSEDLDYQQTTQSISDYYGYKWIEAVNGYNSGGAQIDSETQFYTYQNINAVTFDIQYIN